MSWIPPYSVEPCLKALATRFDGGGRCPGEVITRLALQFWGPTESGDLAFVSHDGIRVGEEQVRRAAEWARSHGIAVLLCVYNYDGKWNWEKARAAFAGNREGFVRQLVETTDRLGLDGVDVDLEGNGDFAADRDDFALFAKELSRELHARGKTLSVAIFHTPLYNAPNMGWIRSWDGCVDFVESMGYHDLYEGAKNHYFRYTVQQDWCRVEAALPPEKLLIGMPSWLGEWGEGGRGSSIVAHIGELNDLPHPTGVCIWDAAFSGDGWLTPEVWSSLAALQARQAR